MIARNELFIKRVSEGLRRGVPHQKTAD